jgi:putative transposase
MHLSFSRVGALFQGPFRARPILDSSHLLHLCRYIHANPVKDGLVDGPANWPYSNYLEWIGEREGVLIDHGFVRAQFPDPAAYKEFVADYIRTRNMPQAVMDYLAALGA